MADVTYIVELKDRVVNNARRIGAALSSVGVAAQKAASSIDEIGLAAGTIAVAGVFKLGAELEQTRIFFDTLTGSAEAGAKIFNELTEFANMTPFSNQLINQNARTLLSFGIATDEVIGQLRMLGDVSGGSADRLGRLTLAFAQVQSAGKLTGGDLLQFIDAGFNPLQVIAEKTGKSMAVLRKEMEKGGISAQMVKDAFATATGEGGKFHNLTLKMSTSLGGLWSTAIGKATFLVSEFGLSMKGIFAPLLTGLINTIDRMSQFKSSIFPVAQALVITVGIVAGLVGVLKLWVGVQKILNTLLIANPIGLIIVAIAALIAIVVTAYQQSETFRKTVDGVWRGLKALGAVLYEVLQPALAAMVVGFKLMARQVRQVISLFKFGSDEATNWGRVMFDILVPIIDVVINTVKAFANTLKLVFDVLKGVARLIRAIAGGDLQEIKNAFGSLGDTIRDAVVSRIELFLKGLKFLSQALRDLLNQDFQNALENAGKGLKQIALSPFNIDTETTRKQAEKAADAAIKAFRKQFDSQTATLGGTTGALTTAATPAATAAAATRAEGVATGGINTFNINIDTLNGIHTLKTSELRQGAIASGDSVTSELLKALADIRPR